MKKESLELALDLIIDALDKSTINIVDKVEIMRNLSCLLSYENYEKDIKILQKQKGGF